MLKGPDKENKCSFLEHPVLILGNCMSVKQENLSCGITEQLCGSNSKMTYWQLWHAIGRQLTHCKTFRNCSNHSNSFGQEEAWQDILYFFL